MQYCQEWVNVSLFAKECKSTTQQLPRTNNHQNIGISRFKKETGHTEAYFWPKMYCILGEMAVFFFSTQ